MYQNEPKKLAQMTDAELHRHRDSFDREIAERAARGEADRVEYNKALVAVSIDRQNRWNKKLPEQQTEILLHQLNKTMGLYQKTYGRLSREGLQWLAQHGRLSQPLAGDVLNDEIPF